MGHVHAPESYSSCWETFDPLWSIVSRKQEMIQNLNYIYNYNDVEALWMLRMKRAQFAKLVETFKSRGMLQDSINTSVKE